MAALAEQPHDFEHEASQTPPEDLDEETKASNDAWDRMEQEAREALAANVPPNIVRGINLAADGVVDQFEKESMRRFRESFPNN